MGNPQKENGYTSIANELLEALARIRINGEAMQVLLVIFRKTYGFNKKSDAISLSQFVLFTGLKKPSVNRAINKLLSIKIINKKANEIANIYSINKRYGEWKPLAKKLIIYEKVNNHLPKSKLPLTKTLHTKETITKETITKERKGFIKPTLDEVNKYIELKNYKINSNVWYNHYESNGWLVGKNKMKNWKAALKTWHYKDYNKNKTASAEVRFNRSTCCKAPIYKDGDLQFCGNCNTECDIYEGKD